MIMRGARSANGFFNDHFTVARDPGLPDAAGLLGLWGGCVSWSTAYTATKAWVSCQQGYAAADAEAGASAGGDTE